MRRHHDSSGLPYATSTTACWWEKRVDALVMPQSSRERPLLAVVDCRELATRYRGPADDVVEIEIGEHGLGPGVTPSDSERRR